MTEKKYQVFVSSTFNDLRDERQVLMQELLALNCIPVGMELYPANNAQWELIKQLIDDCDYYLILLGGRYGSLAPSGISFTHMEYTYAATKNKPIYVLGHSHPEYLPDSKKDTAREGQLKLQDFKTLLRKHRYVPWNDIKNLQLTLRKTFIPFIQKHPTPGWVRGGTTAADMHMKEELLELRRQVNELQSPNSARKPARTMQEVGAQTVGIRYTAKVFVKGDCKAASLSSNIRWQDIFSALAPGMLDPVTENFLMAELAESIENIAIEEARKLYPKAHAVRDIEISKSSFNTIKVQLRAMGLIGKHASVSAGGDSHWILTPLGDSQMATLMAST